jgi:hypothetical protein
VLARVGLSAMTADPQHTRTSKAAVRREVSHRFLRLVTKDLEHAVTEFLGLNAIGDPDVATFRAHAGLKPEMPDTCPKPGDGVGVDRRRVGQEDPVGKSHRLLVQVGEQSTDYARRLSRYMGF